MKIPLFSRKLKRRRWLIVYTMVKSFPILFYFALFSRSLQGLFKTSDESEFVMLSSMLLDWSATIFALGSLVNGMWLQVSENTDIPFYSWLGVDYDENYPQDFSYEDSLTFIDIMIGHFAIWIAIFVGELLYGSYSYTFVGLSGAFYTYACIGYWTSLKYNQRWCPTQFFQKFHTYWYELESPIECADGKCRNCRKGGRRWRGCVDID